MSRARVHEVSSPISLFPFIGILLCTMGALLVVLVAVSRSARDTAQHEVAAKRQSDSKSVGDGVHQKLDAINRYVGSLAIIRGEGERKLRDEQLRLSHVEDHIRRLHEKMRSLESAALELQAMEKEHYDDREQAEREIGRLQQLIEESKKTIESLQESGNKDPRSYAVIPYEGPNGTFRRPIYIECIKNELIVQPEGIHLSAEDLRPPYGAGNPLASVLRASRDYIVRLNPGMGQSRDTEPYPLLLVRPDGLYVYDRARQAIESGDFDLGFELVETDWKVKYPAADPQLAELQQQTLVQARTRQAVLVAAAPRAYRGAGSAGSGEFDDEQEGFEDEGDGGSGGGGSGGGGLGGGPGAGRGAPKTYLVASGRRVGGGDGSTSGDGAGGFDSANNNTPGAGGDAGGNSIPGGPSLGTPEGSIGTSGATGANGNASDGNVSQPNAGSNGTANGDSERGPGGAAGPNGSLSGGNAGGSGGPNGPPPGSAPDKNLLPDGYQSPESATVMSGSPSPTDTTQPNAFDPRNDKDRMNPAATRGQDWALRGKPPRAVPVRRTIRVAVRNDQLAIVDGKVIPMRGDTVETLDDFVKQVHEQIDGWGIAGNGLYWRPVILLDVGPDGQRRADDLARLLKNSGLELRTDETARKALQGAPNETR